MVRGHVWFGLLTMITIGIFNAVNGYLYQGAVQQLIYHDKQKKVLWFGDVHQPDITQDAQYAVLTDFFGQLSSDAYKTLVMLEGTDFQVDALTNSAGKIDLLEQLWHYVKAVGTQRGALTIALSDQRGPVSRYLFDVLNTYLFEQSQILIRIAIKYLPASIPIQTLHELDEYVAHTADSTMMANQYETIIDQYGNIMERYNSMQPVTYTFNDYFDEIDCQIAIIQEAIKRHPAEHSTLSLYQTMITAKSKQLRDFVLKHHTTLDIGIKQFFINLVKNSQRFNAPAEFYELFKWLQLKFVADAGFRICLLDALAAYDRVVFIGGGAHAQTLFNVLNTPKYAAVTLSNFDMNTAVRQQVYPSSLAKKDIEQLMTHLMHD